METKNKPKQEYIFTRHDMYKILINKYPKYRGGYDWYSLERFLSIMVDCDCTDCGGPDFSRDCNLENVFAQRYGRIESNNII
jgi:hypothetical protein